MASCPDGIDPVPPSRLEKRIVELCSMAIQTNDLHEFQRVASELRVALKEQIDNLRAIVAEARNNLSQPPLESLADRPKLSGNPHSTFV